MTKEMMEELKKAVAEEMEINPETIEIRNIRKNNGIKFTGISVKKNDGTPSAVCYLNRYEDDLEAGEITYAEAARDIARMIRTELPAEIRDELLDLSKEKILQKITIQLTSAKRNEDIENKFPHINFLDLFGMFRYWIGDKSSVLISNEIAEMFDLTLQEMYEAGIENLRQHAEIEKMSDCLSKMDGQDRTEDEGAGLFVCTTDNRIYGASIMLLSDTMATLAEQINNDIYLLPSSVHEVLALPTSFGDVEGLKQLVGQINGDFVKPEEILGNTIYQYRRGSGTVSIAL